MNIAILGWGSLIPHPEKRGVWLRISGRWQKDGPFLPIEYARISGTDELTLVLHPRVYRVRTLWTYSAFQNLNKAIRNLRDREGIKPKHTKKIGYVSIYDSKFNSHVLPNTVRIIKKWAIGKAVDAIIWTDLPEKFNYGQYNSFSENAALDYLRNLTGSARNRAKMYVQETPYQIQTHLRKRIHKELGW